MSSQPSGNTTVLKLVNCSSRLTSLTSVVFDELGDVELVVVQDEDVRDHEEDKENNAQNTQGYRPSPGGKAETAGAQQDDHGGGRGKASATQTTLFGLKN